MTTLTYTGELIVTSCPACGVIHAIPDGLELEARRRGISVFCPLGHKWHYKKTIEQELAEARNDATYYRDALHQKRAELERTERSRAAFKGELTKVRKTIHAGKCPWCQRRYKRLAAHMAEKHPTVDVEAEPPSPS